MESRRPTSATARRRRDLRVLARVVIEEPNLDFVVDLVDALDLAGIGNGRTTLGEAADGAAQRYCAVLGPDCDLAGRGNAGIELELGGDRRLNAAVAHDEYLLGCLSGLLVAGTGSA